MECCEELLPGWLGFALYTVKVQAACDATTMSDWSNALTFGTQEEDTTAVYYTVTVSSSNAGMGSVSGGGTYVENTTITITATSNPGYHFEQWNDGNTDSIRTVVVTGNLNFIAQFAPNTTGIDDVNMESIVLFPNPASTSVTISGLKNGNVVTVVDMNGREVYKLSTANYQLTIDVSQLSQGAYFVRITSDQGSVIRKLIIR